MLLNPLPLSQTVTPPTPSPSSVTYFMEGPLGPKTPCFQTRTQDPQSSTQIDATAVAYCNELLSYIVIYTTVGVLCNILIIV